MNKKQAIKNIMVAKLKIGVFLLFLMLMINFGSAFGETISIDERLKTDLVISDTAKVYPAISVKGFWDWLPLVEDTKADLVLTEHDESCGIDCMSEFQITTYGDSALVDDIKFYTITDDNKYEQPIRSYRLSYWGNIIDYETQCVDDKTIIDEKNGTSYTPQVCSQVKVGSHDGWISYNLGEVLKAGNYRVKLEGQKKPTRTVDWIIETQGKIISSWAVWGAVIGVGGVEANITINSPANNSIQYTRLVTTNATANVTGGAYLVNATLYDNSTGSWGARNTTNYSTSNNIEEAHGKTIDSSVAGSEYTGFGIRIGNNDLLITSIKKVSATNAVYAHVFSGSTKIATATFSGDVATFSSPVQLSAGEKYSIVVNSSGSYTKRYGLSANLPVVEADFNWTNAVNGGSVTGSESGTSEAWAIVSINYSNIITSSTKTFTNTYSAGDNILWNMQFCDSDGDCGFATANRTFNIDSSAPTITLNYPTSLIDYGKLNGTLQLNLTATDSNLDKVWYNYNGTNVTIVGATSGVYNLSNITLSTKKNVTIYANDTAGNLNASVFSWDYKVFENSRTHNATSYETAYENYQINVTAGSSLTAVSLVFNGTEYAMTGSYTYSRDLPTSSVGNNSIRYKFTYGAETIYSDYSYQNVLNTFLALCNATYSVPYLNITFKDEATLGSINATMPLGEFDYYLGSGTVTKQLQFINTSENERYSFCASPSTRTLNIDPYVQYASAGYPQRIWNPTLSSYSNTTTSQILYLLSSSDGIYVTFQVVSQIGDPISGVSATAVREISGSDVTVAAGTTGDDGSTTFWLNPDFIHTFNFSKTGYTDYTTTFAPTQTGYTVVMGSTSEVLSDYYQGIKWNTYPANNTLFNGTSYNFQFNLTSTYYDVDEYGFSLRLANGTTISGGSTGTEGTLLTYTYNVGNLSVIYMDYYWLIDGTYTNRTERWIVFNTANTQWSVSHLFGRLNTYMGVGFFGLDDFGRYLITFVILFIIVGTMSYKYSLTSPFAVTAMIFAVVLFLDVFVGFIPTIKLWNGKEMEHILTFLTGFIFAIVAIKEATTQ